MRRNLRTMEEKMNITIANISKRLPTRDFEAAVAAIGRQVNEHFQPEWGVAATLTPVTTALPKPKAPIQGAHQAIIYLGDSSEDPTEGVNNALGYHTVTYAGIPYGFVYLNVAARSDQVWTACLSHEVLELLADPSASATVTGPTPGGKPGTVAYDLEVCDPTQGDTYTIDSIAVSNFVGRKYFGLPGGGGKVNYLDLPLVPFGVRPTGYFQYEAGNQAYQVFGQAASKDQFNANRDLMGLARRNQRRDVHAREAGVAGVLPAHGSGRTLREILATDGELRRRARQAAGRAVYDVIKAAGINVTAADIDDAHADVAAMSAPLESIRADTLTDIAAGGVIVTQIASLAGF
jgi:hypothetical protein